MTGFFIVLHTIICILLVTIILMQSGRGGGLTEGFAAAESVFGAKTNSFLIKSTTIFASLFLATCLSLAFLSSQKDESLMLNRPAPRKQTEPVAAQPAGNIVDEVTPKIEPLTTQQTGDLSGEGVSHEEPLTTQPTGDSSDEASSGQ